MGSSREGSEVRQAMPDDLESPDPDPEQLRRSNAIQSLLAQEVEIINQVKKKTGEKSRFGRRKSTSTDGFFLRERERNTQIAVILWLSELSHYA